MKTKIIGTRVSREVRETIERLAKTKGISISEYVRQLIILDLDNRSVFTTKLKTLQDSTDISETEGGDGTW
jgi:Arc/MetJ-type ribon-helix-helix transcriptional regulator